ncbi:DNA-binding GntR family transcriptional regulator [Rhizobium petrolearium]|uniref:GntR family transcriptional regulator n=1 Tax=Neorhizobium petrolearium TaxID=515361 RepID=UPI001AE9E4C2|nr:GntR family transcriptional regulator [Neorhizobium petrolearium]MBP1845643.1 DNA-binding GntR family transcriptional regulator [Neorhizobium petrolearium]
MRDSDRLRLEHPKALTSMVTERLRQAIIDGDFQLGESMSEDQLSAVFGVSRSPVREALKALEFEGLVEVRPKRGSFIFAPSIEDVEELCEFRLIAETQAAILSMRRAPDAFTGALDKATGAMRNALEAGDDRGYGRADTAFHKNFFTFCGNRLVQDAYQLAEGRIATIRTILTAPNKEQRELSFSEHCMIADALRERNWDRFQELMSEHVGRTMRGVRSILSPPSAGGSR